jgi:hypothetical protein
VPHGLSAAFALNNALVIGLLVTVQVAWLAALAFAAYVFLWSP